ncbi:UNKNOWN [Stylonychia lemnae]|uniref:Uncharacterized protein n=1 Tax=Stylonychia lemnae TaxID=5949 RepID=A0A078A509_STYLE|nr:UNKNOWN [Stylonychia lemnae]|eukprot:CDW76660.1 UNKNOWN [Stylonychia lemnae]
MFFLTLGYNLKFWSEFSIVMNGTEKDEQDEDYFYSWQIRNEFSGQLKIIESKINNQIGHQQSKSTSSN